MRIYGRDLLYQWDINQKVTADNMDVGEQVHFTNTRQTAAFVVKAYEFNGTVVANIPNLLLQNSYPITAYRYRTVGNASYTWDECLFDIKQRTRPSDYVYNQTEVISFEHLDRKLEAIEARLDNIFVEMPVAGDETVGGVKVPSGSGIEVDEDGNISINLEDGSVDFAEENEIIALI